MKHNRRVFAAGRGVSCVLWLTSTSPLVARMANLSLLLPALPMLTVLASPMNETTNAVNVTPLSAVNATHALTPPSVSTVRPRKGRQYVSPAALAARSAALKLPRRAMQKPKQKPVQAACVPALPREDGACNSTPWMREYARFHAAQRCNSSAPLLVYSAVQDRMRCTYLGDKVIIISFALRAAARLKRVLYIDWPSPCGVATYLQHVCIDWRVHPTRWRRRRPR